VRCEEGVVVVVVVVVLEMCAGIVEELA